MDLPSWNNGQTYESLIEKHIFHEDKTQTSTNWKNTIPLKNLLSGEIFRIWDDDNNWMKELINEKQTMNTNDTPITFESTA